MPNKQFDKWGAVAHMINTHTHTHMCAPGTDTHTHTCARRARTHTHTHARAVHGHTHTHPTHARAVHGHTHTQIAHVHLCVTCRNIFFLHSVQVCSVSMCSVSLCVFLQNGWVTQSCNNSYKEEALFGSWTWVVLIS